MAQKLDPFAWTSRYQKEIARRLKKCKNKPTWQSLPAGRMRMEQGMSPKAAATKYLAETSFGKQRCALKR